VNNNFLLLNSVVNETFSCSDCLCFLELKISNLKIVTQKTDNK